MIFRRSDAIERRQSRAPCAIDRDERDDLPVRIAQGVLKAIEGRERQLDLFCTSVHPITDDLPFFKRVNTALGSSAELDNDSNGEVDHDCVFA